jgi:predicted nucleic acid-binding protein
MIFFIDSGVLWRLLDPEHPEREACLNLMSKCFRRKPEFIAGVNTVVIVETMICLVKRSKIDPGEAANILWNGFLKSEKRVVIFPTYRSTLEEALILQNEKKDVEFSDCVIAATMKENAVSNIYTTNIKHFSSFSFVEKAIDPRFMA